MRPMGLIKHYGMFRRVRHVAVLVGCPITAMFGYICQNMSFWGKSYV